MQEQQAKIDEAEAKAAKRTKIEIIKDQIEASKSLQNDLKEDLEQVTKVHDANIWYTRCLEIEGQLELS